MRPAFNHCWHYDIFSSLHVAGLISVLVLKRQRRRPDKALEGRFPQTYFLVRRGEPTESNTVRTDDFVAE